MLLEITKTDLVNTLVENELLEGKKIIAVCETGSRLYNLSTENSDYDFKVIYLPSKEDIYSNIKGVSAFKLDFKGTIIEGQLLSLKNFMLDLGKPSLNSLEILYDTSWVIDDLKHLYADDYFLAIYRKLQENVESLFYLNKGAMFNTLRGHLFTRKKRVLKSAEPEKEYMHFVRIYNILQSLHTNSEMKNLIRTDGSLLKIRQPENVKSLAYYVAEMDKILALINETEFAQSFNAEVDKETMQGYHKLLMNGLFK